MCVKCNSKRKETQKIIAVFLTLESNKISAVQIFPFCCFELNFIFLQFLRRFFFLFSSCCSRFNDKCTMYARPLIVFRTSFYFPYCSVRNVTFYGLYQIWLQNFVSNFFLPARLTRSLSLSHWLFYRRCLPLCLCVFIFSHDRKIEQYKMEKTTTKQQPVTV